MKTKNKTKETLQERLNEVFEIAKKSEKPIEFLRSTIEHLFDVFLYQAKAEERKKVFKRLQKELNRHSHPINNGRGMSGLDAEGFFVAMENWERELLEEIKNLL